MLMSRKHVEFHLKSECNQLRWLYEMKNNGEKTFGDNQIDFVIENGFLLMVSFVSCLKK